MGRINDIKYNVEHNLGQYREQSQLITTEEELCDYIKACIANKVIAIDTETDGLDPILNNIAGVCIYTPGQLTAYVPINHISAITGARSQNQLTCEQVAKQLNRITEQEMDIIMFNAKFDTRVIRNQLGVYLTCTWDCYLAARCLNENELDNSLKKLHNKYVLNGVGDAFKFDDLFSGIPFTKVPADPCYLYAAHDAIITYELYMYQKPFLTENSKECVERNLQGVAWLFHNVEMPCVNVVSDMEDVGVKIDTVYAKELSVKYHKMMDDVTKEFEGLCNEYSTQITEYRKRTGANCKLAVPINISSSTQIAVLLYDVLGLKNKDGSRGTGEDLLESINHPITKVILKHRELDKLLGTYIDKLPTVASPKDGRIHCKFNQYGADTGRFSSSDPNLQNIPSHNKEIRKIFVATEGYVLMASDYSQQEPKVMTQLCGDKTMLQAYLDGKDLYAQIASLAFNKPYEQCLEFNPDGTTNKEGKERRTQAKSILLGVLYGRGIKSIAEQLKTTEKKAQQIKDSVFKGFPAIKQFEQDSLEMARNLGYVTTLWGRKRRLPNINLPEYEFKWKGGKAPDDDPLDFRVNDVVEVPFNLQTKYLEKLKKCKFSEKYQIVEMARKENIEIVDNGGKIAGAERQCVNSRIQGSAADMSKLAMILVGNNKRLKELGFRLLIPVHDELIGECPKENAKEACALFSKLMSEAAVSRLKVPITCDVEITDKWYGEEIKL